jgi:cytochrome P450
VVSGFDGVDFFTDESLVADPYPYFASLRAQCPVVREPHHGAMMVTGYDEAAEVFSQPEVFSSCVAPTGPFPGVPFEPEGDDVGDLIEQHRDQFPLNEHLVTFDPPKHTAHRSLLKRLFTPKRLRESEDFIRGLTDRLIDEFHEQGKVELMGEFAKPLATLVIADLLGVPEEDHQTFRRQLGALRPGLLKREKAVTTNPIAFLEKWFTSYIEDRRREPRDDVLSALATTNFPDGSTPEISDVVHVACFLFGAGQDTTARLLTAGLRVIAERPDVQASLRDERDRIPNFIEEALRIEGPVKSISRLARKSTTVAGVDIPAGTVVTLLPGAANRDPDKFEEPDEFRTDRPNVREHLAFSRGIHTCVGAPLARAEARIGIGRLLDRMGDITISEAEHGPADARHYEYEPTYILRGLRALHLEYKPIA